MAKYEYAEAINESLENYMNEHHLNHADRLIVLVSYDVEIGMRYRGSNGKMRDPLEKLDDSDIVDLIENNGIPFDIVTSWEEARAQLKNKCCEFYMSGNDYLYKRGYAAFEYAVSLDEDGEVVWDDLSSSCFEEAETLKPFWERIIVTDRHCMEVDFDEALKLMDPELREKVQSEMRWNDDEQDFFDAYEEAHLEKYGEDFKVE